MKKEAPPQTSKIEQTNYTDTRITLTEAVLVPFFVVTFNMFSFVGTFLEIIS